MSITIKSHTITARHVGLLVVIFALGVTIPRLVFAFALSDNLVKRLGEDAEFALLITSAIMGAFVLTLGNAYLSHMLAQRFEHRDALWVMTAVAWGANLLFAVVIIAPSLRVGIDKSALSSVLQEPWDFGIPVMRWVYCIVLALAFELLAAGSMAAYALASRETDVPPRSTPPVREPVPVPLPLDRTALTAPDVTSLPGPTDPTEEPEPEEETETPPVGIEAAIDAVDTLILNLYLQNPAMTKEEVARQITHTLRPITRQTVGNRLRKLQERGLVTVNGVVTVRC